MPGRYNSPVNSGNPNAALVHETYGPDVARQGTHHNNSREGVGPATWSTAPYIPPKNKGMVVPSPPGLEPENKLCTRDGCSGHATKRWPGLCAGHGAQMEKLSGDAGAAT